MSHRLSRDSVVSLTSNKSSFPIWAKREKKVSFQETQILLCLLNKLNKLVDNDTKYMTDLNELFNFKQLIEEPTRVSLITFSIIHRIATAFARNIVGSQALKKL